MEVEKTKAVVESPQMIPQEVALAIGDLSKLTSDQRVSYYNAVCNSVGLNPLTRPFDYITLNGKLTLYARREATDQLRKLYRVSSEIKERVVLEGMLTVTTKVSDGSGRMDESSASIYIKNLQGEALANAHMKCETKSKRRATLSFCGLGILDETELETIPERDVAPKPALTPAETPVVPIDAKKVNAEIVTTSTDSTATEPDANGFVPDPEKPFVKNKVAESNQFKAQIAAGEKKHSCWQRFKDLALKDIPRADLEVMAKALDAKAEAGDMPDLWPLLYADLCVYLNRPAAVKKETSNGK